MSSYSLLFLGFIPFVYLNWLLDDKKCLLTKLEHYFLEKGSTNIHYEGFVSKKLKSLNIHLDEQIIDQLLSIILFHSFIQSYKNIIIYHEK